MQLSNQDMEKIADVIRKEIGSLKLGNCSCGLSPETQKKMSVFTGHFMGMIEDIGDGNTDKGIESMRSGLTFFKKVRGHGEKIGGAVSMIIVMAIISGVGKLIWMGYKVFCVSVGKTTSNP